MSDPRPLLLYRRPDLETLPPDSSFTAEFALQIADRDSRILAHVRSLPGAEKSALAALLAGAVLRARYLNALLPYLYDPPRGRDELLGLGVSALNGDRRADSILHGAVARLLTDSPPPSPSPDSPSFLPSDSDA